MELKQAIEERRTVRIFKQKNIPDNVLMEILEAARRASCAANNQRLRYVVARTQPLVNQILALTKWAGRVQPKRNPVPGISAPTAFIAVTAPAEAKDMHIYADAGAAIQSMELAAWELGVGCCWIGSIDIAKATDLLQLDTAQRLIYLLALGYAGEKPVMESVDSPDEIPYYLDNNNQLHVPKLSIRALTTWK